MRRNLIPIIFLAAGIIIGGAGLSFYQAKTNLPSKEAGEIAIAFINQVIQEDVTASLMNISEESGVYKIHLKIEDKEYDSYVTKDGKLLFSNAFNMGQQPQVGPPQEEPANLDDFAKCLTEKGAKFYGAFWCSHCKNQKEMFGESQEYLPYIECSTPDGTAQLDICREKNISGYPTWEFPDGSRESGELSLQKLSEKTGCQPPQ